MALLKPRRGEVWWVRFDPSVGSEIQKTRLALILSNNISNRHLDRMQVVPITSRTAMVYPGECLIKVDNQISKALIDQIRTVSINRLGKKISDLSDADQCLIDEVVLIQLGLI